MQEEAENLEIELELPEGEVDPREADVDDSIPDKQNVEELNKAPKDELDTISEGVQKRIDKLTYKMREAERQRDEAVTYAQSIHSDNSSLRDKLKSSDSSLFKEYDNRIQSDLERAKIHLKDAQEQGDGDAIATATEQLSRSAAEHENLRRLSAQQKVRAQSTEQQVAVPAAPIQQPPQPDPKAQKWADKNEWFGSDQAMTYAAFGIHKELVEEGIDPSSDGYYSKVDGKMKEYFPNKFSEEQSAPVQQVAASSRGATGKKSARKIKLTPSQVAIAKRLNVPLEEYAKHIEQ
jgi:hypothetical protein